eukprot:scaffold132828_cov21-Tisochrysis_lutea.AAC.1
MMRHGLMVMSLLYSIYYLSQRCLLACSPHHTDHPSVQNDLVALWPHSGRPTLQHLPPHATLLACLPHHTDHPAV